MAITQTKATNVTSSRLFQWFQKLPMWQRVGLGVVGVATPLTLIAGTVNVLTRNNNQMKPVQVFQPEQVEVITNAFCSIAAGDNTVEERQLAVEVLGGMISHLVATSNIDMDQPITSNRRSMRQVLQNVLDEFGLPHTLIPQQTGTSMYAPSQSDIQKIGQLMAQLQTQELSTRQLNALRDLGNVLLQVSGQSDKQCVEDRREQLGGKSYAHLLREHSVLRII